MDGNTSPGPELGFGRDFTDHMAIARHHARSGWSDPEIVPFGELSLSPAAMVFHYGQAIFEGLKAFTQPDGVVALFRPWDHADRFDRSARRLAMPELGSEAFVRACRRLVRVDRRRVPSDPGQSLYLRPLMFATEAGLGVRPAWEYLFAVIGSPVGTYFAGGVKPITLWANREYSRAAPGGTGSAKCAGNYAASLAAKQEAAAHGCDDTLWLDALEHRWIEELGGMNIVFVQSHPGAPTLVAPPISDTILDGITRRSLLRLASHLRYQVVERPVSIDEACRPGTFDEAFACGTAAGVAPIGVIRSTAGAWTIGNGQPGPVTARLRDALLAMQGGRAEDPYGWRTTVTEPTSAAAGAN
jgi:branched-chain amino acid aminotransferase